MLKFCKLLYTKAQLTGIARTENVVVISKPCEQARFYMKLPSFCSLVSYGNNIVASVDERVADFVKTMINSLSPSNCFGPLGVRQMTEQFAQFNFAPLFQAEFWLPDVDILRELPCKYEMRILERDDFAGLYLSEWSNALGLKRPHLDMLAIGAYDSSNLIGLAGCSADCGSMWQIGIDVLPEYRKQGIASALTSKLAVEILQRGKIPFYCCAGSNLGSARNAVKSGFRPAWVMLETTQTENNKLT
jgi:GNAT superfamily N-acetyltransferase